MIPPVPLVQPSIYAAIHALLAGRDPAALCTVVRVAGSVPGKLGAKMLVYSDGSQLGTVGGAGLEERVRALALETLAGGSSGTHSFTLATWASGGLDSICGGTVEVYVELLLPLPHLLLCGGGHVAQAIAAGCPALEYRYSILDDRPEYRAPERFPSAIHTASALSELDLSRFSDIYLLGYSWESDLQLLIELLPRTTAWMGAIGSKTKLASLRTKLAEAELAPDLIDRLHGPIGLAIGAESPAEIAVAVLAERIQRAHA